MRLALFFTAGVSLQTWANNGSLSRETALYKRLQRHLDGITFITYGDKGDQELGRELLPGITVLPNKWRLPPFLYSWLAPFLHRRELRGVHIFQSNQTEGGWAPALAARMFGGKAIVRSGFPWSIFYRAVSPNAWWGNRRTLFLERWSYRLADRVVLSAPWMQDFFQHLHSLPPGKIMVIPNYVDTELFSPRPELRREPGRLLFVGRLTPQKNLKALLDAVACIDGPVLHLVGEGSQRGELEKYAESRGVRASFWGTIPNHELPHHLAQAQIFVLPSLYEGMPKSLVEAMASGTPVLATDVTGNRDVVEHGRNGLLCGTSSASIAEGLRTLLGDSQLRDRLGTEGRSYVSAHFSLDQVEREYLELYQTLSGVITETDPEAASSYTRQDGHAES